MIGEKKLFIAFVTFSNIFFFFLSFAKISFSLTIPERSEEVNMKSLISLIKRDGSTQYQSFIWPTIDGSNNDTLTLLNDHLTELGFWYWNSTLFFELKHLADSKNATKQREGEMILLQAGMEYLYIWVDECWKLSNQSAVEGNRVNTSLARVAVVPIIDSSLTIQGDDYNIASPVELACFERAIDGDPNVPVFNHTIPLINQLKWDKQSATTYVQGILEKLKEMNGTSTT